MQYRPEIDGLRALAVVPVLLYHLKIPILDGYLLPGGFLGVDIFFVISGYLITHLLIEEMANTGRIKLGQFYARRARRILPALLLVILVSLAAGFLLMTPSELSRLLWSAVAALGFFSNGFWYVTLGEYGAQSGLLQPLLHTWSLAIEEQFYLIFPLLLLLLKPHRYPKRTLVVLLALSAASLLACIATTVLVKELSFFSPISRAWELLVGAMLALVLSSFPRARAWRPTGSWLMPKVALAVILIAMATLQLPVWAHPGLVTLPVVLATAALIWFAQPGEAVSRALSAAPMILIGRLSYSIYLWHFPIFAFGRLSLVGTPGALDMALWLALTLVAAGAGYVLIERPFRFSLSPHRFATSIGAALVLVAGLFAVDRQTTLLRPANTLNLDTLYGGPFYDNEALQDRSWSVLDTLAGDESIGDWFANTPSLHEQTALWFQDPTKVNILVLGNSHSKDMFNALHAAAAKMPGFEVARFGIASDFPKAQMALLLNAPNFRAADVILVAPRYSRHYAKLVPRLTQTFANEDKIVVFAGNTAHFVSPGRLPIYDYFLQRQQDRTGLSHINSIAYGSQEAGVATRNSAIEALANDKGALFLSRSDLVCPPGAGICTLVTPRGDKVMYDYGHWTLEGAAHIAHRIAETHWLAPVFEALCQTKPHATCTLGAR